MVDKIIASEFIRVACCDICGDPVSDGKHNGLGDINFWGAYIDFMKGKIDKVEMRDIDNLPSTGEMLIRIKTSWANKQHYQVCYTCRDVIVEFINSLKEHFDKLQKDDK